MVRSWDPCRRRLCAHTAHPCAAKVHPLRARAERKGSERQIARRSFEAPPDRVQNDAGVCGGGAGRQPAGGLQVGERRIRSKHGEPHCACKALRHNAGGASERKSVTAEERPSIRLCRMVDALFSFMRQCSFLCAFRACKTG